MFVYPGGSTAAVGLSMEKNSLVSEEEEEDEGKGKPHSMFQHAGYHRGFNSRCVFIRGGTIWKKKNVDEPWYMPSPMLFVSQET